MSKKNLILISIGAGLLILISIFIIIQGNMNKKSVSSDVSNQLSGNVLSGDSTNTQEPIKFDQITLDVSWKFEGYVVEEHTSNEVTSNVISINVNGQTFNIGTYPGKAEEVKDFSTYDMPSDTIAACKSVLETGGDYFYVVRKDNTSLSVMTRFMDDAIQKADNTKSTYVEKMVIQIPQVTPQATTQETSQPQAQVTP